MIKSKDLQPRLLYPARLSFKIKGEIRIFQDKKKLKEFVSTRLLLQQMLKGLLEEGGGGEGGGEKEKEKKKKTEENSLTLKWH